MWPRLKPYQHLSDVVDLVHAKTTVPRGSTGFLERARRGSLRFAEGFLEDIEDHIEYRAGGAPSPEYSKSSRPSRVLESARQRMERQSRRDSRPEIALRQEVWRTGLRYRVDSRPLQSCRSRADLVFSCGTVAVFVDGCFSHSCPLHDPPEPNGLVDGEAGCKLGTRSSDRCGVDRCWLVGNPDMETREPGRSRLESSRRFEPPPYEVPSRNPRSSPLCASRWHRVTDEVRGVTSKPSQLFSKRWKRLAPRRRVTRSESRPIECSRCRPKLPDVVNGRLCATCASGGRSGLKSCATMIANELRRHSAMRRHFEVRPDQHGSGQETFTPLGYQSASE